jgi:hypothetical protein
LVIRGGVPGRRPVRPRLRDHPLPVRRHGPQRPAGGPGRRCHRADGCARHREGHPGWLRLGWPVGRHRRGALAGPLPGPGLGQRVPDRQPGRRPGTAAAGRRAHLVVPVLLRHRPRPGRVREVPARVRRAHLAARLAEMGLLRRHVRAQRGRLRQPGSRRDRDPQLPVAARRGRRTAIRRPGAAARRLPGHRGARHHPGGRRQRRAARRRQRLRQQIHRQVRAPGDRGRHRPQPAARGPAGFRAGGHRRQRPGRRTRLSGSGPSRSRIGRRRRRWPGR